MRSEVPLSPNRIERIGSTESRRGCSKAPIVLISLYSKRSAIRRREASPRSRDRNARSGRNKADKFRSLNWLKDDSFRGVRAPASLEPGASCIGHRPTSRLPGRSRPGLIGARSGSRTSCRGTARLPGRSRPGLIGASPTPLVWTLPRRASGAFAPRPHWSVVVSSGLIAVGTAASGAFAPRPHWSCVPSPESMCSVLSFRGVRAPASLEPAIRQRIGNRDCLASGAFAPRPHWSEDILVYVSWEGKSFRGVRAPASLEPDQHVGFPSGSSALPGRSRPGLIGALRPRWLACRSFRASGAFAPRPHWSVVNYTHDIRKTTLLPGRSRPGLIGAVTQMSGSQGLDMLPGRSRPGLIGARTSCSPRRPPGTGFRGVRAPASLEPGHLQLDRDAVHRFRGVRAPASLERRMGCQRASNYFRASGAFAPRPHWSEGRRTTTSPSSSVLPGRSRPGLIGAPAAAARWNGSSCASGAFAPRPHWSTKPHSRLSRSSARLPRRSRPGLIGARPSGV